MSDDELGDFFGNDNFADEPTVDEENGVPSDAQVLKNLFDEDNEVDDPTPKKKRIVQNPQPKLNEETLTGKKGIQALRDEFKDYKPDLKADPYANLAVMMKKYQHWSHVMFPKLKFDDIVSRCETLGDKRAVKVYMMKSRLDMPLTDEDFASFTVSSKNKDDIIETEYNDDGVITTRDESDDENMYDPLENTTSTKTKSHIPEHVQKMMEEAKKNEAAMSQTQPMTQDDEIEDYDLLLEQEQKEMEEEQRRLEREADEAMADFDF